MRGRTGARRRRAARLQETLNLGPGRAGEMTVVSLTETHASGRDLSRRMRSSAHRGIVECKNGTSYEIQGLIGAGGAGIVYRAKQLPDGRIVALKLVARPGDPISRYLLRWEARTLAELDHPNIVKAVDHGDTADGEPYLAMELVAGKPLDKLFRCAKSMTVSRACKLLAQLAEAMSYVHARGFVHCDLKPANVLVVSSAGGERAVVVDFGISSPTGCGRYLPNCGSLLYMSPEQLFRRGTTASSDIYQLGLLSFQMLFGELPFEATLDDAVAYRLAAEAVPERFEEIARRLPRPLVSLVRRMLAREPLRRPAVMSEVAAELSELVAGGTSVA